MNEKLLNDIFDKNYEKHSLKKIIVEELLKAINEDHWITIGADKETEKKGTHILVKDGETNKQATERKIAEWKAQKGNKNKPDGKARQYGGLSEEQWTKDSDTYRKLSQQNEMLTPQQVKFMSEYLQRALEDDKFGSENKEYNEPTRKWFAEHSKINEKRLENLKKWFDLSQHQEKHMNEVWKKYLKEHPEEFTKSGDKPADKNSNSKKEKFSERYEKEKERLKQKQDEYYKINYESGQEIRKHRDAVTELIKDITDKDKIDEIVKKYISAHPEIEDLNKKVESSYAEMSKIDKELDKLKEDIAKEILDTNIDNLSQEDLQDLLDAVKYTENFSVKYETRGKLVETKRKIQDKIKSIEYNKTKKEVTQIAGVSKGKPMSFDEADNGRVNPNYGNHDIPGISFSQNCQSCVVCYQLRKNGFNVKTKGIPVKKNGDLVESGKMYELAQAPELAWIDPKTGAAPEVNKCDATTPSKAYKWLDKSIEEGGTYSFRVIWKGAKSGHIVIAHRIDGVLSVYDPQTNKEYFNETSIVDKFFDNCILRARYNSRKPYLFRTDNLDANPDFVNEIVEKA